MLIIAAHSPQGESHRNRELRSVGSQVLPVETVFVDYRRQPRVRDFHAETEGIADSARQAAQLGAAAGQEHLLDVGVTRLDPEKLEAAADLVRQVRQHRPHRPVDASRTVLLVPRLEREQLLFGFRGNGGHGVVDFYFLGRVEIKAERPLDGSGDIVPRNADVPVHQDARAAHERDGGTGSADLHYDPNLVTLAEPVGAQRGAVQVLTEQGAFERAQEAERFDVHHDRLQARLAQVADLVGEQVTPGRGDDDLHVLAVLQIRGIVERVPVELHLVDRERYVTLRFPADRVGQLLQGHAGQRDVPRDRLAVSDRRDDGAPADAGVVEQCPDLIGQARLVDHLVTLEQA